VLTSFVRKNAEVADVRIQPNGRIVAAGGGGGYFALARYTSRGKLDPSFGDAGTVMTNFRTR
jgi:Domain of unknown function (DUF5122) beta-propeller